MLNVTLTKGGVGNWGNGARFTFGRRSRVVARKSRRGGEPASSGRVRGERSWRLAQKEREERRCVENERQKLAGGKVIEYVAVQHYSL